MEISKKLQTRALLAYYLYLVIDTVHFIQMLGIMHVDL